MLFQVSYELKIRQKSNIDLSSNLNQLSVLTTVSLQIHLFKVSFRSWRNLGAVEATGSQKFFLLRQHPSHKQDHSHWVQVKTLKAQSYILSFLRRYRKADVVPSVAVKYSRRYSTIYFVIKFYVDEVYEVKNIIVRLYFGLPQWPE